MTRLKLKIHVKILTKPGGSRSVKKMIGAMKEIYDSADINVALASREVLDITDPELASLNDLDVGRCNKNPPTGEQKDLAQFRQNVPDREIVIYFCNTLSDAFGGCSIHPDDKPMAAISAQNATLYTLAHEVGHVLGLEHTTQGQNRLMTEDGTSGLVAIPVLTQSEIDKMRESPLLT